MVVLYKEKHIHKFVYVGFRGNLFELCLLLEPIFIFLELTHVAYDPRTNFMSVAYFFNRFKKLYITLLASFVLVVILPGCSHSLVKDDTYHDNDETAHCSGSEWADDSTLAVLPIPVVAFLMPHTDLNEIKADDYLKRCGDTTKLINREVNVGRAACVPTVLTRVLTLGIWQWCPAHVSWKADVKP
jgi:hypothetical protein